MYKLSSLPNSPEYEREEVKHNQAWKILLLQSISIKVALILKWNGFLGLIYILEMKSDQDRSDYIYKGYNCSPVIVETQQN